MPLCPPQAPHAARTRTRAAAVRSQRLTAWATARPASLVRKSSQYNVSCKNYGIFYYIIPSIFHLGYLISWVHILSWADCFQILVITTFSQRTRRRYSLASKVTDYGFNDRSLIPWMVRIYFATRPDRHCNPPSPVSTGTGSSLFRIKETGAWRWMLISNRSQGCINAYLLSAYIFKAWCLSARAKLPFTEGSAIVS
jgi:hypothetical protein